MFFDEGGEKPRHTQISLRLLLNQLWKNRVWDLGLILSCCLCRALSGFMFLGNCSLTQTIVRHSLKGVGAYNRKMLSYVGHLNPQHVFLKATLSLTEEILYHLRSIIQRTYSSSGAATLGGFPKLGIPFWGSSNKDYSILGALGNYHFPRSTCRSVWCHVALCAGTVRWQIQSTETLCAI